ncbi:hypothetical protein CPJCM30710_07690 [Clostridium polyendosporum]|uniref:Uncharacterized protein n=1 Tax=Clostridium polyendosporum TaxID=69208 RepID=A0A919S009_9CLOT|nr:hypothetical protein [Clostridium polyendosporum]GIM28103.1 hypothetical protein CPJCM30710_07690 [Clostridium polyendosporum]
MKKISVILIISFVSFLIWGIIKINITNTAAISKNIGGSVAISQEELNNIKDEFGDNFVGFLNDNCEFKIFNYDGDITIEVYDKVINFNQGNIKQFLYKTGEKTENILLGAKEGLDFVINKFNRTIEQVL